MKKRGKKIKIARYLSVYKRKVNSLSRRKIRLWFKNNLKGHPLILGILFFIWVDAALIKKLFSGYNPAGILRYHLLLVAAWFILVGISNALKDKGKVKWYLRKRLVGFLLVMLTPLGIILLWSGAKFKKTTKIVFTVIFGAFFLAGSLYYDKKYEKLAKQTPLDRIAAMVSKPKKGVFLKRASGGALLDLRLQKVAAKTKEKLAVSEVASRCSPAVVSIKTKDKDGKEIGLGSGFLISQEGIIVTNFHVIESAYQAEVGAGDKVFKEVYFIKGFPELDIAVLKIDSKQLPALSIGNSDELIKGQFVTVLGNPLGFEQSVSNGLISAIRTNGNVKLIQMTAPVSPGSSGGPVINEYGEVIGVTTIASFFFSQNLNFAIPINYLNDLIKKN